MWSERYDRVVEDVFAIQDEISQAIAEKLEVTHLARAAGRQAHGQYRGLPPLSARPPPAGPAELRLDTSRPKPTSAGPSRRTSGSSRRWSDWRTAAIGTFYGNCDPSVAIPEVRLLLDRALAMDARFAETHTSLGFLDVLQNFAAAEQHFLLSHQAKPDQALTVWWNAALVAAEGRLDEAIAMARRAGQLEPTIPMYSIAEGLLLVNRGQLPLAIETIRKGLEMDRILSAGPGAPRAGAGRERTVRRRGRGHARRSSADGARRILGEGTPRILPRTAGGRPRRAPAARRTAGATANRSRADGGYRRDLRRTERRQPRTQVAGSGVAAARRTVVLGFRSIPPAPTVRPPASRRSWRDGAVRGLDPFDAGHLIVSTPANALFVAGPFVQSRQLPLQAGEESVLHHFRDVADQPLTETRDRSTRFDRAADLYHRHRADRTKRPLAFPFTNPGLPCPSTASRYDDRRALSVMRTVPS